MPVTASADELRAAYRRLARQHHPDTRGGAASDMAAINEAWHVLRDPARRAMYDASLRDRPPAATARPVVDDDDDADFEPVPPGHPVRWGIPLGWVAVLVVLGLIFVVSAYATGGKAGPGTDGLLRPGDCVVIDGGYAVEVPCTGRRDGVVQSLPPFDAPCPAGTSSYRDRNGMSQVCLLPG